MLQTNCYTYLKPDQLLPKALGAHKAVLNLCPPSFSSGLLLQFVWNKYKYIYKYKCKYIYKYIYIYMYK